MSLKLARLCLQITLEIEDLFFFFFTFIVLYILFQAEFLDFVRLCFLFW